MLKPDASAAVTVRHTPLIEMLSPSLSSDAIGVAMRMTRPWPDVDTSMRSMRPSVSMIPVNIKFDERVLAEHFHGWPAHAFHMGASKCDRRNALPQHTG